MFTHLVKNLSIFLLLRMDFLNNRLLLISLIFGNCVEELYYTFGCHSHEITFTLFLSSFWHYTTLNSYFFLFNSSSPGFFFIEFILGGLSCWFSILGQNRCFFFRIRNIWFLVLTITFKLLSGFTLFHYVSKCCLETWFFHVTSFRFFLLLSTWSFLVIWSLFFIITIRIILLCSLFQ